MTLEEIELTLDTYLAYPEVKEDLLKMIEQYAEEAYQDGFEQGWEENDFH